MHLTRREFLQALACASAAGLWAPSGTLQAKQIKSSDDYYDMPKYGNVSFLHFTDCHAQLLPSYYREPAMHMGTGAMKGKVPHLVGKHILERFNIPRKSREAYALSYLDFEELSLQFGAMGGFAQLATLVKKLRTTRPDALLLDGGDTWQGSATSLWTNGQDMVDATKLLGVDAMTGHWEFTYGMDRVKEIVENDLKGKIDFIAQNIDDSFEEHVFKPYTIKEQNGVKIAIIGQAFPYTPIANPRYMVEDWTFGIKDHKLQEIVDEVRGKGAQVVVVLSHNGMDVDLKMASRVTGVDAIMGGHTHDAVPDVTEIKNAGGKTLVINSGSMAKFLSVLDLDVKGGKVRGYKYKLVPVFSRLIEPDPEMSAYITKVREPYEKKLSEKLAVSNDLLYRRDTFNGTFDQLIMDAMIEVRDAQIAFSPGFRWGMNVLPGEAITFEDVMTQTAITYPEVTRTEMTGNAIKIVLEGIADNRFSADPYSQQGGDMVRVGKMKYTIDPGESLGNRIQYMELDGDLIEPNKKYVVAGWASVNKNPEGPPIWDVVSQYLRDKKTISISEMDVPTLKNVKNDPGMSG